MANTINLQALDIYDVQLKINKNNSDFYWYQQRNVFEERVSSLYNLIAKENFTHFFDIGANYGYISVLVKRAKATIQVIAVEADPHLIPVIKENLALNGINDVTVINAIAAESCRENQLFSINPNSSLDNRVNMPDWVKIQVSTLTLDKIINDYCNMQSKIFLKIDTQGFEQFVLSGAEKSLNLYTNWILKMEFAPHWLESQGTKPLAFLHYLCARYQVSEAPERITFGTTKLDVLFNFPIHEESAAAFLEYVCSLNANKLGWVDLLVRPKQVKP